jgi:hypothetical protein
MEISEEKFKEVRNKAKEFYDKVGKIRCPYLNSDVHFNFEGFEHLLSKSWNRGRSLLEQYTRLRLLPKVVDIIKISHTLQEYDERKMFVRQKINSRWEKRLKNIYYYVFIALVKEHNIRFKIVVKEIEGGSPFFWSVYPSWRIVKDYNGNNKKVFYSGNLEEE